MIAQILKSSSSFLDFQQRLAVKCWLSYDTLQLRELSPIPHFCLPELQPKKKRGGKRHRKNKELQEMSELRKQQNRLKFGEEAEE